ncbi:MAG TPA: SpoIID/LytB domain-containing protein, partial [Vicinamibacterales bacterium]
MTAPVPAAQAAAMPDTIRVQVREGSALVVRAVPLEDYVAATILSEFDPASGSTRTIESMYEVQAIVSRSYALSRRARHGGEDFDVCATAECQVYEPARLHTSRWAALARHAADETRGEILTYDGAPAEALFHADCGGHTSSAADVWGGARVPYLVDDRDDVEHGHDDWTFQASAADVAAALDADPRT